MQSNIIFAGIDVSKRTFDTHIHGTKLHFSTSNDAVGFKALLAWFKKQDIDIKLCWLTFEYVGFYEYRLVQFCTAKNIRFTRVSGLEIKKSMGLVHGKSDKTDARRIAKYAYEKQTVLLEENDCSVAVFELKKLFSLRNTLIQTKKTYQVHISEWSHKLGLKDNDSFLKSYQKMFKEALKQIEKVETQIQELIRKTPELFINFNLLLSIPGIGFVNAIATIIYTENFTKFSDPRKYASFSGVAPFEHTSGTSLRGKAHVCFYAHKNLKSLLTQAARSAVVHDSQMMHYYEKKISEGKHYGTVLNAVRFKLITRMFAVVRNQLPFVDNYANKIADSKKAA
jgi:transposase